MMSNSSQLQLVNLVKYSTSRVIFYDVMEPAANSC